MLSLAFCRLPFEVLLSIVDDNVGTLNPELCGICPSWGGASVILTGCQSLEDLEGREVRWLL